MKTIATILIAMTLTTQAYAQSMRCRDDLADVGDDKPAVLAKCGEPVAKVAFCRVPANQGIPGTLTNQPSVTVPCESVDEWTYDLGSGRSMTTLRFESGRLRSIRSGDRIR